MQLKKPKREINNMKGCSSIRKISSSSELVGLGGILQGKLSERWVDVDKMLGSLKTTLDNAYKQADDMIYLSKASLGEWQQEREVQEEIEAMVIRNCIQSLQEEFEERLWDQNARFYGSASINWLEKIKESSNFRQELDATYKSLSMSEIGQLTSHGSAEFAEEGNNSKRTDNFYRKVLSNHGSLSTSLWEENGKHESKTITPENLDPAQLKHMSKGELVNYFKSEMTKMKRNHALEVHELTEEYFSLKRRGSSLPLKKDKEIDILRKKIRSIRKKVSDAAEKMSLHSLSEANLSKMIENLNCAIEDMHMEALISEEVYKCVLQEVTGQIKCDNEELDVESTIMQDIYGIFLKDAAHDAEAKIEDTDIESIIMQGLLRVIFRETMEDAEVKLNTMSTKYMNENKIRVSLEMKALEKEKALSLEVEEKERLKQEILKRETLALEAAAELAKEKERLELALRDHARQQELLISESSKELDAIKCKLDVALKQIDLHKVDMVKLNQQLELVMKDLRRNDEEIRMLVAVTQEKQKTLLLFEAKDKEHREQMESMTVLVHGLSKAVADFECRVVKDTKRNSLRHLFRQFLNKLRASYISCHMKCCH